MTSDRPLWTLGSLSCVVIPGEAPPRCRVEVRNYDVVIFAEEAANAEEASSIVEKLYRRFGAAAQ